MHRFILKTTGDRVEVPQPLEYDDAADLLGATLLDVVNLGDGRLLLVDESGHPKGLPDNPEATRLYWTVCRPGVTHRVAGDVLVVPTSDLPDFAA